MIKPRTFEGMPWKWHPRSEKQEHNGSIYAEPIPGHAYAIAIQPRYVTNQEWSVHAPMIAAVPDLLAALKRQQANISRWLETGIPATPEESKSISDQIDAAIAKAEGRAP